MSVFQDSHGIRTKLNKILEIDFSELEKYESEIVIKFLY